MDKIQKRLRHLEAHAVVSLLVFGVLAFSGFAQTKQRFDDLTVERLNVDHREKRGE